MDWTALPPRRCFLEPIPEIFAAAEALDEAAGRHLAGDAAGARAAIRSANDPRIRDWVETVWSGLKPEIHRWREVTGAPPKLARDAVVHPRAPNSATKRAVIERDGHRCRFCGIPVIRAEIRKALHKAYPDALPWGKTNMTQHAGFQAMWVQYDHVLPHSRGGSSTESNVVVTCGPCNFGRGEFTLAHVALLDPRDLPPVSSDWDGLERLLPERRRILRARHE